MRKLVIPKRETKFENQILDCANKIVAKIVSEYSKNETHFFELYQIGISKWEKIERNFSEKNINKSGALIIRQEILNYILKMENKKFELEKLQNEVAEFYTKLGNELNTDINYKIFFSKFSENADILFIGINPGAGEQIKNTKAEEKFEYINDSINEEGCQINNYTLAKETINVFELAKYEDLLKKLDKENLVVKTNFFYLVTTNEKEIYELTKKLSKELEHQFYHIAHKKWLTKMIEITNPKLIICEGNKSFDLVVETLNNEFIVNEIVDNQFIYSFKNNPLKIIGYKRNYSNIIDKEKFAKVLKMELDKIYK